MSSRVQYFRYLFIKNYFNIEVRKMIGIYKIENQLNNMIYIG